MPVRPNLSPAVPQGHARHGSGGGPLGHCEGLVLLEEPGLCCGSPPGPRGPPSVPSGSADVLERLTELGGTGLPQFKEGRGRGRHRAASPSRSGLRGAPSRRLERLGGHPRLLVEPGLPGAWPPPRSHPERPGSLEQATPLCCHQGPGGREHSALLSPRAAFVWERGRAPYVTPAGSAGGGRSAAEGATRLRPQGHCGEHRWVRVAVQSAAHMVWRPSGAGTSPRPCGMGLGVACGLPWALEV